MTDQSALANKVAALLAKAASTAAQFPEEADALNAKAAALMAKYSLDAAVVAAAQGVTEEGGITRKIIHLTGSYGIRKVHLAHGVARATGCKGIHTDFGKDRNGKRGWRYRIEVFGTVSDVAWCETLYDSLASQMDSQISHETKRRGLAGGTGRSFGTAFVAGYTASVVQRLKAINATVAKEAQDAASPGQPSVSMVLASKATRVDEEVKRAYPNTTTKRVAEVNSYTGYGAGQTAGERATISRGSVAPTTRKAIG